MQNQLDNPHYKPIVVRLRDQLRSNPSIMTNVKNDINKVSTPRRLRDVKRMERVATANLYKKLEEFLAKEDEC